MTDDQKKVLEVINTLDGDVPHLGDQIYVDECDESTGGVATINGISQTAPTCIFLVSFNEVKGLWNWNLLIEEQIELEARFFGRKAEIR